MPRGWCSMTRAAPVEPWKGKPIAQPKTGLIVERFARWLELIRRTINIAAAGHVTSLVINTSQQLSASVDIIYASGAISIILPPDANYIHPQTIKNEGADNIFIETDDAKLIEGFANALLFPGDSYTIGFQAEVEWWII